MYRKKLDDPEDHGVMVNSPVNSRVLLDMEVFRGAIYFLRRQHVQDAILNFHTNAVTISSVHVGMLQRTFFNDFVIMHHSLQPGRWHVIKRLSFTNSTILNGFSCEHTS